MKRGAYISAISHWVPEKVLTNSDLEKMVDTTDEWIRTRTGISERRILEDGKASSDMGAGAVKKLIEQRGIDANDIDVIIVATVTPDMFFPSTANLVQDKVEQKMPVHLISQQHVLDLFMLYRWVRRSLKQEDIKKSLWLEQIKCLRSQIIMIVIPVFCLEMLQEQYCLNLRMMKILVLLDFILHSDGSGADYLHMKAGGSKYPATVETVANDWHYIYQDGKTVFKFAVQKMADIAEQVLVRNSYTGKDVKLMVPHQANLRIIDAAAKRLGLDPKKVLININKYGNTTAATIPLALSEAYQQGKVEKNDLIVLATFGAGFTWGSALIRWGINPPSNGG